MAVKARYGPGVEPTNYTVANAAIDQVLATATFEGKTSKLRKRFKKREMEYKLASRRELARGKAVEKQAAGLQSQVGNIKAGNAQVEAANQHLKNMQARWQQDTRDSESDWAEEFNSKNKFNKMNPKDRRQAWKTYYTKRSESSQAYREMKAQEAIAKSVAAQAKAAHSQYESGRAKVESMTNRYERGQKQTKSAYGRYEAAIKKYNKHTSFVPYQPA